LRPSALYCRTWPDLVRINCFWLREQALALDQSRLCFVDVSSAAVGEEECSRWDVEEVALEMLLLCP
jgi:hypothetical protein